VATVATENPENAAAPTVRRGLGGSTTLVVLAVLIALLSGVLIGRLTNQSEQAVPEPGRVDVGFAQDMSAHHAQAVEMSGIALARSVTPEVRTLAYDVATSQQSQIGTMQGWLRWWNRPAVNAEAPMQWMDQGSGAGHSMPGQNGSAMPGMATPDELRTLRQTSGSDFDALYLRLLLRHHEGGLPMADYARVNAETALVAEFADRIGQTQTAESDSIRQLLAMRDLGPLPLEQPHR